MRTATFNGAKVVVADIVCIQQSYVTGSIPSHLGINIRWGTMGKRKGQRVAIVIAVNTRGQLMVEAQTDIVDHPYIMAL